VTDVVQGVVNRGVARAKGNEQSGPANK